MVGNAKWRDPSDDFHLAGSDALILVFDLFDRSSFEALDDELQRFFRFGKATSPQHFPIAVVGNKSDLGSSADASATSKVGKEEVVKWCEGRTTEGRGKVAYHEVSAMSGAGVEQLLQSVTRSAYSYTRHFGA
jgi:GTPase SAR1 family protein